MYQRGRHRSSAPGQTRPHTRRSAHPVLALQRLIGNRGTVQVLARQEPPVVRAQREGRQARPGRDQGGQHRRLVGENSIVVITFKNARIRGYAADESGKTEQWKAVDFDAVNRAKTSIGAARP
jgi:hypothetical protein